MVWELCVWTHTLFFLGPGKKKEFLADKTVN